MKKEVKSTNTLTRAEIKRLVDVFLAAGGKIKVYPEVKVRD